MKEFSFYLSNITVFCPTEQKNRLITLFLQSGTGFTVLKNGEDGVYFKLSHNDGKKISESGLFEIVSRGGFLSFVFSHIDRIGLLIGAFVCIICLYVSSLFIWDIQTDGNGISDEELLSLLTAGGLSYGTYIPSLDIKSVENSVLISCDKLSFISINLDGSTAHIEYGSRNSFGKDDGSTAPSNIVADEDGQIINRITQSGTAVCSPGDVVKKGELLISGLYESNRFGTRAVKASGKVYAEVSRRIEIFYPFEAYEKVYTSKSSSGLSLIFFGRKKSVYSCDDMELYDEDSVCECVTVFGEVKLPIKLEKTVRREYEYVKKAYTKDQAVRYATIEYENALSKTLCDGEITSKETVITLEDDGCRIICNLTLIRDIAKQVPLG